jgi:hypothetical protein
MSKLREFETKKSQKVIAVTGGAGAKYHVEYFSAAELPSLS